LNLEHVETVRARIAEIERRFAGLESQPATSFEQALNIAQAGNSKPCPQELEPLIADAAEKYGIDPSVIKSVISVESGFRPGAVSGAGAQGLMQLMPETARALGVDPMDVAQNIDGGTKYLSQQINHFGSLESGLAAYNAGPGSVTRYGGVPPYSETRDYVAKVMSRIAQYSNNQ
jgi:soluble lytic murein transglycosylase-like protein